jgi:hypothetical protein
LQLADSILEDQTKSKIAEPNQGVAGGSVLYVASYSAQQGSWRGLGKAVASRVYK